MSSPVQDSLAENALEEMWFGAPPDSGAEYRATQSLAAAVAAARGVASFPVAAARAMRLLDDPASGMGAIESVLSADVGLVTSILRVANCALYRPVTPIANVREAVARIGMRSVRDLVAGVAAMGAFKGATGAAVRLRSHAVRVGAITRVLASEWAQDAVDDAFLTGLLHDVGKLLTHQVGELDYGQLPPSVAERPDAAHTYEHELLGYDHAVLGAHVLDHWHMPREVVLVTAWHHNPALAMKESAGIGLGVSLVRLADAIEYGIHRKVDPKRVVAYLAAGSDAQYAGFDPTILEAMWPKLEDACQELEAILR